MDSQRRNSSRFMQRPRFGMQEKGGCTLLDSRFDRDACGVGFVASVSAIPSHAILQQAMTALARLAHRGATAADGKSSDGVGLMTAIPTALLIKSAGLSINAGQILGVGMLMIPHEESHAEQILERCLASHNLKVLKWRDVPTQVDCLGEIALGTMPRILQALIVDAADGDSSTMERRLYLSRKQFERLHEEGKVVGYVCSLSTQTLVYKAMCTGNLLGSFYSDLASEEYVTPFAIFSPAICDEHFADLASSSAWKKACS